MSGWDFKIVREVSSTLPLYLLSSYQLWHKYFTLHISSSIHGLHYILFVIRQAALLSWKICFNDNDVRRDRKWDESEKWEVRMKEMTF